MHRAVRGYYLYSISSDRISDFGNNGVEKKIKAQVSVLHDAEIECEIKLIPDPHTFLTQLGKFLPFPCTTSVWNCSGITNADFLYIRKPPLNSNFIKSLNLLRINNPNALILLEIPTYPYDGESSTIKEYLSLAVDKRYRRKLHHYIDFIVDLFGYDTIFGIPTIQIRNGILVDSSAKRASTGNTNTIKMVCTANFTFWHGLDRLIQGIYRYYENGGTRSIYLTLVGDGEIIPSLKTQVSKLHLESRIRFPGKVNPENLKHYYDNNNLAVESLGRHRTSKGKEARANSSLKSREYLNAGLPFFGEGVVDVFEATEYPYYYQVPSDDSPIDMYKIIDFFDNLYNNFSEQAIICNIHRYAEQTVDMHTTFAEVIRAIKVKNTR